MVCKSVACSNIPNKHVLSVDVRHKYAVHSLTESYFEKLLSIFDKNRSKSDTMFDQSAGLNSKWNSLCYVAFEGAII